MTVPIKIAIADDHQMVIRGMRNMLEDYPRIEVLQVFSNAKDVLQGLKDTTPDVLLLDIHIPGMNGQRFSLILNGKEYPAGSFELLLS
jgi:DNA-binding NarL/FixJ family response regulator